MTNCREAYLRSYYVIIWETGEYQTWEHWTYSVIEWKRQPQGKKE